MTLTGAVGAGPNTKAGVGLAVSHVPASNVAMSTKAKEPVPAAERMRRYRKRRRNGLRCVRVILHETEIDSLIEKGFLQTTPSRSEGRSERN
jgi:hypothetical protein